MLRALLVLHLAALAFSNPFHKYPYVFLLDVGNEELEKVNTEQIRISKQGGSLALRYPAIGDGDDVAHVRVSGIDFGTDLKANIVDGGPGYKYVVLVLMGNPGVSFDAVVTIQTVPKENSDDSLQNIDNGSNNQNYPVSEESDPNDSAEDLSDSAESEEASQVSVKQENAELTQGSSNVYNYAVNEALSGYGNSIHYGLKDEDDNDENSDNDDGDNDDTDTKDIHSQYRESESQAEETNAQFEEYTNDDNSEYKSQPQEVQHGNDDYYSVIDNQNYAVSDGTQVQANPHLYEEYQTLKQNIYDEQSYSQGAVSDESGTVYIEEPGDNHGPLDLEEIFSDEYDGDDGRKYSDTNNNNFIDRSDGSAVAY